MVMTETILSKTASASSPKVRCINPLISSRWFGDKGAAVFDTFVNVLGTVKNAVSEVVGFITTYVVPVAEQVLQVIVTQVIPGIVSFIQAAAPTICKLYK